MIGKIISKILFYVLSAALFVYAASRSLDFIQSTLGAENQLLGFLALAATSGGALIWLFVFLKYARGGWQSGISAVLVAVDLLGEVALFTFDTLLQAGANGLTAVLLPEEIRVVVLALSALIAANIIAVVVYHIADVDNQKKMAEDEAENNLQKTFLDAMKVESVNIARDLAPELVNEWAADFRLRFKAGQRKAVVVKPVVAPVAFSANGHSPKVAAVADDASFQN